MNAKAPSNSDERLDVALLDALWNFDDPVGSEARFRRAIDAAPADSTQWAELSTQLARSIGLQGRYDEARALLDELGTGIVLGGGVGVGTVTIAPDVF